MKYNQKQQKQWIWDSIGSKTEKPENSSEFTGGKENSIEEITLQNIIQQYIIKTLDQHY